MPFNGAGVFQRVRNWVADATAGIKIRADFHDTEDDGFATGLSNCITKDGQTIVTQNIPWNSKRITGLQDPVNPQDAATKAYTDAAVTAGGTFTGNIVIQNDNPALTFNNLGSGGDAGSVMRGAVDGVGRWMLRPGNNTAETGANAGSDFDLHRYADDGAYLGQVLAFERATGLGTVAGDPTVPLGIATKQYVQAGTDDKVFRAGDQMTGKLISAASTGIGDGGPGISFEVRGPDSAGGCAMTFLIPSVFGSHFGLASDGNFYMGGYSHGAGVTHRFWTTRDFGALPSGGVQNARLAYAGDVAASTGPQSSPYEPYTGGVLTGWQWAIVGTSTVTAFRIRYMQLFTTSWFTIGYTA